MPPRRGIALAGLIVAALPWSAPAWALPQAPSCAEHIRVAERLHGIPTNLLAAISLVESGRPDDGGALVAWPWTINAAGEGRFFATKAQAMAEVARLRAAGVRSIDVGCMQVNLLYHPDAFASLEDAFEPASNVAYAAQFLKNLYEAAGHWLTAAVHYHSQSPAPGAEYRQRLARFWSDDGSVAVVYQPPPAPRFDPASFRRSHGIDVAAVDGREPSPWLSPRPASAPAVEAMRQAWRDQAEENRARSRRIAEAYRQAQRADH